MSKKMNRTKLIISFSISQYIISVMIKSITIVVKWTMGKNAK